VKSIPGSRLRRGEAEAVDEPVRVGRPGAAGGRDERRRPEDDAAGRGAAAVRPLPCHVRPQKQGRQVLRVSAGRRSLLLFFRGRGGSWGLFTHGMMFHDAAQHIF
jgi:hypothetical protein